MKIFKVIVTLVFAVIGSFVGLMTYGVVGLALGAIMGAIVCDVIWDFAID